MKKAELIGRVMDAVRGKKISVTDLRCLFSDELENASRNDEVTPYQRDNWYLTERELVRLKKITTSSCQ